jgi:hypothetical protein
MPMFPPDLYPELVASLFKVVFVIVLPCNVLLPSCD